MVGKLTAAVIALLSAGIQGSYKPPDFVVKLKPYKKYRKSLKGGVFKGEVGVYVSGDGEKSAQSLDYLLKGVPAACSGREEGARCAIRIHSGTCHRPYLPYYKGPIRNINPWNPARYVSNAAVQRNGRDLSDWLSDANGATDEIVTGIAADDLFGRIVVVRDHHGRPIACGSLIKKRDFVVNVKKFPGYKGDLNVSGEVDVFVSGDGEKSAQRLDYRLEGVHPNCRMWRYCKISIHEGKSCASPLGPWSESQYRADKPKYGDRWPLAFDDLPGGVLRNATGAFRDFVAGKTIGVRNATGAIHDIVTGKTIDELKDRVIVVYDANENKIACGNLNFNKYWPPSFSP